MLDAHRRLHDPKAADMEDIADAICFLDEKFRSGYRAFRERSGDDRLIRRQLIASLSACVRIQKHLEHFLEIM